MLALPHLYLASPLGVAPLEFRPYLWLQKRVTGQSYGICCLILRLAVLMQYRLMAVSQDGQTDRHTTTAYRASIATRGKKGHMCSSEVDNVHRS